MKKPGPKIWAMLRRGFFLGSLAALPTACTHPGSAGSAAVQATPAGPLPSPAPAPTATAPAASWAAFHQNVQPIMELHCYPCHSEARSEKDIRWDLITDEQSLHDRRETLSRALGMLYAGKMPPICAYPLSPQELVTIISFIEARQKVDPPAPAAPAPVPATSTAP
jgi:hypothetical protein